MTPMNDQYWNLRGLVISYAIATLLVLSYLWPTTRLLWDGLDRHIAFSLNSLVQASHSKQLFWAFANLRVFDYIAAFILLGVLGFYIVRGRNAARDVRVARVIVICILLVLLVAITREFLFKDIARDSPSLVLQPFTMLSEHTPFDVKDHSTRSFPGDHATVVATFTFLAWCLAGWRYGLVSLVFATCLVLPRLVAGAHWFSDVLIGGIVTALVTVPLVVFTPVQRLAVLALLRVFASGAALRERVAQNRHYSD